MFFSPAFVSSLVSLIFCQKGSRLSVATVSLRIWNQLENNERYETEAFSSSFGEKVIGSRISRYCLLEGRVLEDL